MSLFWRQWGLENETNKWGRKKTCAIAKFRLDIWQFILWRLTEVTRMRCKSQRQAARGVQVAMWLRIITWQNCVFLQKHLNNISWSELTTISCTWRSTNIQTKNNYVFWRNWGIWCLEFSCNHSEVSSYSPPWILFRHTHINWSIYSE